MKQRHDLCSVAFAKERSGSIKRKRQGQIPCLTPYSFHSGSSERTGIKRGDLEAVVVSKGPGSYTGLRIGVSAAKGIAYAASIPLIGIDTTLSMFYGIREEMRNRYGIDRNLFFVPMLDARRMEIYYSVL